MPASSSRALASSNSPGRARESLKFPRRVHVHGRSALAALARGVGGGQLGSGGGGQRGSGRRRRAAASICRRTWPSAPRAARRACWRRRRRTRRGGGAGGFRARRGPRACDVCAFCVMVSYGTMGGGELTGGARGVGGARGSAGGGGSGGVGGASELVSRAAKQTQTRKVCRVRALGLYARGRPPRPPRHGRGRAAEPAPGERDRHDARGALQRGGRAQRGDGGARARAGTARARAPRAHRAHDGASPGGARGTRREAQGASREVLGQQRHQVPLPCRYALPTPAPAVATARLPHPE